MPSNEVVVFVLAAGGAFGLSIGGVAAVYLLDQRRQEDGPRAGGPADRDRAPSPFDRAG